MKIAPQKIATKYYVGLTICVLILGLFFTGSLYLHMRSLLTSQVADTVSLVHAEVAAIQSYVRDVLRPTMFGVLPDDRFVIEAMSTSYVSRQIMDKTGEARLNLLYRRTAFNARNPEYEPNDFEMWLIDHFRSNPDVAQWSGARKMADGAYYVTARPVRFEPACMRCHGEPDQAPKELLERYGDTRGFGHVAGPVRGVDVVGVRVQDAYLRIKEAAFGSVVVFGAGSLTIFGIFTAFFNRLVVANLRRLTNVMHRQFEHLVDPELLNRLRQGDEVDELVASAEAVAGDLKSARRKLEDYAANLERMVEERTADLAEEAAQRQTDVALFVDLLAALNRAADRPAMLSASLEPIVKRFEAAEGVYICLYPDEHHAWPPGAARPRLPANWRDLVTEGLAAFELDAAPQGAPKGGTGSRAFIPVESGGMTRGLLCLTWDKDTALPTQAKQVLMAVGRQLGVAMENLDALDNLVRQRDMLSSVFKGIADPLFLLDGACRVHLANDAAVALLAGLGGDRQEPPAAPEAAAAQAEGSLKPLLGAEGEECPLRAVLDRGNPSQRRVRTPDGRDFTLHIYPLPGAQGADPQGQAGPQGRLVLYARDVSSEKKLLDQMRQSEKAVAVSRLASGLAHEINNPLGVILTYCHLLEAGALSKEQRADLGVIVKHTRQAQKVLGDMLAFARPKHGEGPSDAAAAVRNTAEVFRVQAESRGATIEVDIADQPFPPVAADQASLEQILTNLLINALDAVQQAKDRTGGRVTVAAAAPGGEQAREVVVTVSDNGPGVPEEDLTRVFDPFYSTKDVGRGTGLGLTIVFGLMRELGGAVEVENLAPVQGGKGGGARFTLRFPAHRDGAGEEQA